MDVIDIFKRVKIIEVVGSYVEHTPRGDDWHSECEALCDLLGLTSVDMVEADIVAVEFSTEPNVFNMLKLNTDFVRSKTVYTREQLIHIINKKYKITLDF